MAGLVASAMGDSAVYLLGATSDSGLNSKGAFLLQWTWIQWLKENGCESYDLGGIDPERNPGVYHFKSGLAGLDVTAGLPAGRLQQCIVVGRRKSWPGSARAIAPRNRDLAGSTAAPAASGQNLTSGQFSANRRFLHEHKTGGFESIGRTPGWREFAQVRWTSPRREEHTAPCWRCCGIDCEGRSRVCRIHVRKLEWPDHPRSLATSSGGVL